MAKTKSETHDIDCLNQNILHIDLDDLGIDAMERRVELTLASVFGDLFEDPPGTDQPCGTFSCSGYFPVR